MAHFQVLLMLSRDIVGGIHKLQQVILYSSLYKGKP